MSKKRKRKAGLLAAAACLATALMATPVSAALSDAEKEALAQNIHDYLTATFTMTEENKAELREAGGYYDIVLDELEKTEEDTGALVSVGEVRLEETDTVINCTADVDFEGYDAEVVMTVNASTGYPQNFVVNVDYPLDVRMSEAGMNTVIGLVVVFAILFFLTGVIYLFRYIGRGSGQERRRRKNRLRRHIRRRRLQLRARQFRQRPALRGQKKILSWLLCWRRPLPWLKKKSRQETATWSGP